MEDLKKEILLGDCLELMKNIPNKSIDMILCDLPYGTTQNKWDSILPLDKLWEQYNRIIKDNGAIVLTANQPFATLLIYENIKYFRYDMIWKREQGTDFLNANIKPLKIHENILVFYKKKPTYNKQYLKGKPYRAVNGGKKESSNYGKFELGYFKSLGTKRNPTTFLEINSQRGLHPTQKPLELFEYLIKTYTNENDLVLDNTAGSGTTAIACINTKRQFIVIEKEQKYYNIILDRVEKRLSEVHSKKS